MKTHLTCHVIYENLNWQIIGYLTEYRVSSDNLSDTQTESSAVMVVFDCPEKFHFGWLAKDESE